MAFGADAVDARPEHHDRAGDRHAAFLVSHLRRRDVPATRVAEPGDAAPGCDVVRAEAVGEVVAAAPRCDARAGLERGDLVVDVGDLAGDLPRRSVETREERVAVLEQREESITLCGELSFEMLRGHCVSTD